MNKIEIEKYNKKLDELGKFFTIKNKFTAKEIIDWLAECVVIFSNIGVNQIIIEDFLRYFAFCEKEIHVGEHKKRKTLWIPGDNNEDEVVKDYLRIKTFGPFTEELESKTDFLSKEESFVPTNSGDYTIKGKIYYSKIAFSVAREILKNSMDDKRIVPVWLIDEFKRMNKYNNIVSSLEMIENKYQDRDIESLITNSITLLDSILDLDNDLKKIDSLGGKLAKLRDDKKKNKEFGVSFDLVVSLDNSRLIRNEKIIHKDKPLKYDIPFMVAASFTYLTLFFVETVILNGEIIKE